MNEKERYVIAIDLDGTLITGFDNYDTATFDALRKVSQDNLIVIATGRPYRSSKYFYDLLNLDTPIINYNGALVHNPKDENFKKSMVTVEKKDLLDFINANKSILINIFSEIEDEIFLWQKQDFINQYLHLDGGVLHVGPFEDILYDNPNGAIAFTIKGSEAILENYFNTVKTNLKIRFWDCDECVICEIYNPLTSKANGLLRVCEYYNIDTDHLIAIGDGHNDIDMLKLAKYSVAMKNSHPDLLSTAKFTTSSVSENGVKEFISDFFNLNSKEG